MRWSEMIVLGLSFEEADEIRLKAERLEERLRPDGRYEYVPETPGLRRTRVVRPARSCPAGH
ncbi:MAG: hypothetical protein KatS3mg051_2044 [Anaerolineae bacterium]|nr:MAG: hypothetical protein KatS3mg051_2044 [Anaerolineae bacterium]